MDFFKNRYVSLDVRLQKRLPLIWKATMKWLNDEVFLQVDDEELAEIDQQQRAFEKSLFLEIEEVRDSHYGEARRALQETATEN